MNSKIAYVPVVASPYADYNFTAGVATYGERGYAPLRDSTGITFDTYEQAAEWCRHANRGFGITDEQAAEIVTSSMLPA